MAVILNKANLILKDANGNIGKIEQLSSNDLAKIKTAVSDVALVVNQSNHTPIEATTTNKGVVQLATSADVVSGASDKVVTAEQLHNSTTGTSALATENLARIDAVVTEAGIPVDHTNTNQLKTAVTTLISNAAPATATANTLGVVKPDGSTITVDGDGTLTCVGKTIVRSVNGVHADAEGNIQTGFPSSSFISNNLPNNDQSGGISFTAPANGFISIDGQTNNNTPELHYILAIGNNLVAKAESMMKNEGVMASMPVAKGDTVQFRTVRMQSASYKFIYAIGEEP